MMGCTAKRQDGISTAIFIIFISYFSNVNVSMCTFSQTLAHQVVQLWIFTEEGLVFSLLLVHKVFYVHIKAG